ncbi:MAG: outer membrane beta-barrel protein [Bacteroidales bacterium]|nr:outer membrane beta-barrel protein [Bacteroidales bacterium]
MKRTIFSLLLTTLFLSSIVQSQAQTEKGKFIIGAGSNLEFTSISTKWDTDSGSGDDGKSRNLALNAQIGYFVLGNCAVGLEIPYIFIKEIDADEGHDYSYISSSISFIPFLRIYIGNSKIKPYLHGGVGAGRGMTKYFDSGGDETKVPTKILASEIGGGLGLFLNEQISIDLGIGYASANAKWVDKNTNMNWKSTISGIGATIGIIVYL